MEKQIFKIKAAASAPDVVTQGNLMVTKKDGRYETDHAPFAEFLEREYGVKDAPAPPAVDHPPAPSIPRPDAPPAANKPANEMNTGGNK